MTELIQTGPFQGLKRNGYSVILADPAWSFSTRSPKGKDKSPEKHYRCMTLEEIKALPVRDLAAKNAMLLLWTIDTHLPQALEVVTAWGFTYKTVGFYWAKTNADGSPFVGMGFWTRANPEQCWLAEQQEGDDQCLLATTGAPKRQSASVRRLILAPRREHSRKPEETRERIEQLVDGPYVDLFCRESRPGWDTWGNEASKFDRRKLATFDDSDIFG